MLEYRIEWYRPCFEWHGDALAILLTGDTKNAGNGRRRRQRPVPLKFAHPGVDLQYFMWDQAAQLTQWGSQVDQNGGQITLIGHSYGAATAASVVANGLKVQTLVTLDPVSYLQPDFHQVAANSGQWLNFVAAGGGLTLPNAIAGMGGAWNDGTMGYATSTTNVSTDHGGIEGNTIYNQLLGPVH